MSRLRQALVDEGLRREREVQSCGIEAAKNLQVDLVGNVGPMFSLTDEVDGAYVEAEVPKPAEPHCVLVLGSARF